MSFAYLASPYSDPDATVREQRYRAALRATAKLAADGACVFSPIVHTHHLEPLTGRKPHDFWMDLDRPILRHADKLVVLMLEGWKYSRGVAEEMEIAARAGIPIEYMEAV